LQWRWLNEPLNFQASSNKFFSRVFFLHRNESSAVTPSTV
jgi:hypothetical protein